MKTLNDKSHLGVEGHVVIRDADSKEVLLNSTMQLTLKTLHWL